MMEKNHKFCILLCDSNKFEAVKKDIQEIFKKY